MTPTPSPAQAPTVWFLLARDGTSTIRITPGLTLRERADGDLQVLKPGEPGGWLRFDVEHGALWAQVTSHEWTLATGQRLLGDRLRLDNSLELVLPHHHFQVSENLGGPGRAECPQVRLMRRPAPRQPEADAVCDRQAPVARPVPPERSTEGALERPSEGMLERPSEGMLERPIEGTLERPREGVSERLVAQRPATERTVVERPVAERTGAAEEGGARGARGKVSRPPGLRPEVRRPPVSRDEGRRAPAPRGEVGRPSAPPGEAGRPSAPQIEARRPQGDGERSAPKSEAKRSPAPRAEVSRPSPPGEVARASGSAVEVPSGSSATGKRHHGPTPQVERQRTPAQQVVFQGAPGPRDDVRRTRVEEQRPPVAQAELARVSTAPRVVRPVQAAQRDGRRVAAAIVRTPPTAPAPRRAVTIRTPAPPRQRDRRGVNAHMVLLEVLSIAVFLVALGFSPLAMTPVLSDGAMPVGVSSVGSASEAGFASSPVAEGSGGTSGAGSTDSQVQAGSGEVVAGPGTSVTGGSDSTAVAASGSTRVTGIATDTTTTAAVPTAAGPDVLLAQVEALLAGSAGHDKATLTFAVESYRLAQSRHPEDAGLSERLRELEARLRTSAGIIQN